MSLSLEVVSRFQSPGQVSAGRKFGIAGLGEFRKTRTSRQLDE